MEEYKCLVCGYIYDPREGEPSQQVAAGTPFVELPDTWVCPICSAEKEDFIPQ